MISIILPTMNEEKAIAKTIKEIDSLKMKNYELLVVDKSEDRTPQIAKSLGARVITQTDKGKGSAMIQGGLEAKGDILVFIDADGTYDIKRIPDLVKPIIEEDYDSVVGIRKLEAGKNIKHFNWLGDKGLSLTASILYGKTSDLLTGFRAIKKDKFLYLNLKSTGFEIETEIFIKSKKGKLKVKEIETNYQSRLGETKLNPIRDGFRILGTLLFYKFKN